MRIVVALCSFLALGLASGNTWAQADPCDLPGVVCGCTADPLAGTCDCSDEALAKIEGIESCGGAAHVVCVDNFQYSPALLAVQAGDTVAWVNVENGCNVPPGSLAGESCEAQHSVDSMQPPAGPFQALDSPFLCSPNAAEGNSGNCLAPAAVVVPENVFCATYGADATLHYTCQTNPVHTILMHGAVLPQ